jgi:hypothetical protein
VKNLDIIIIVVKTHVATLALGSRPKQRGYKVASQKEARESKQEEAQESHHILPGVQEMRGSMREWILTLPRQLPLWEMESQWILEISESDFRGQNLMDYGIFYIIGKLLECRCLKWARIAQLNIWNINYDQKKGWESNC